MKNKMNIKQVGVANSDAVYSDVVYSEARMDLERASTAVENLQRAGDLFERLLSVLGFYSFDVENYTKELLDNSDVQEYLAENISEEILAMLREERELSDVLVTLIDMLANYDAYDYSREQTTEKLNKIERLISEIETGKRKLTLRKEYIDYALNHSAFRDQIKRAIKRGTMVIQ